MSVTTWYKHRIYCETDSQWEYKITENDTLLTVCPTNSGHTITSGSASIYNTLANNQMEIIEESTKTGGTYKLIGYKFHASAGTDNTGSIGTVTSNTAFNIDINSSTTDMTGYIINITSGTGSGSATVLTHSGLTITTGTGLSSVTVSDGYSIITGVNTSYSITTYYPQSILSGVIGISTDQIGDNLCLEIAPNTTIGAITSNVTINDTVINVDSTSTSNMKVGRYLTLYDGTNTSNSVLVTAVDAGTITVETGIDQGFTASTPTYVQMTIKMIENYEINAAGNLIIGQSTIGGAYMDSGTVIKMIYSRKKINSIDVKFSFESLY